MTFAHFQTPGNTPSVKDLLIKPVRIGAMTSEASFNKRALSLSSPTALLDFKDLSSHLTLSRWKGRVLEVKTVETFWNGFANTFPTDTKYWFMILATESFSVCHFPFSKIEETVDYLVSESTCFFTGIITLGVFNHLTKTFRFEIFFPRDWYNSEVFCTFSSGKYYWRSVFSWSDSLYLVSFQQVALLPMEFYFP